MWMINGFKCLVPQMDVGLAAAEAIKKVHGKHYKVGTSPNILCKSANHC